MHLFADFDFFNIIQYILLSHLVSTNKYYKNNMYEQHMYIVHK